MSRRGNTVYLLQSELDLCELIKKKLKRIGKTQIDLAKWLGMSWVRLENYLDAKERLPAYLYVKICKFFEDDYYKLFATDDKVLCDSIRAELKRLGKTQKDLSEGLGFNYKRLGSMFGTFEPLPACLYVKICAYLKDVRENNRKEGGKES